MQARRVPKKITPCPILEAVVQLRFDTETPSDVVTGGLSQQLRGRYSKRVSLPIMNLPEELRIKDPQLKFAPWFRLEGEGFFLHLGPSMLSIHCPKEYKGWRLYRQAILEVIEAVQGSKIIKQVREMGLKYISFFEGNIFEKTKAHLSLDGCSLIGQKTRLESKFEQGGFDCMVRILNRAFVDTQPGSVVEVGVRTIQKLSLADTQYGEMIDQAHRVQKQIFFSLPKEDFLNQLNPEFE